MAKQIKVREDNYFAVQGWMVTELKLKGNALMLYAIIYGFSQTTNTAFTGSVDYLCEWLGGVSRPTIINTLDNLVKQGLLTKSKPIDRDPDPQDDKGGTGGTGNPQDGDTPKSGGIGSVTIEKLADTVIIEKEADTDKVVSDMVAKFKKLLPNMT